MSAEALRQMIQLQQAWEKEIHDCKEASNSDKATVRIESVGIRALRDLL